MAPSPADFLTPNQIILLASGAVLVFTIRRWRYLTVQKQKQAGSRRMLSPAAAPPNPLSVREVSTELAALLAELEETSRCLTAQLDNRYTKLEQLLTEADGKIARLEQLSAAVPAASSPLAPSGTTSPAQRQTAAGVSDAERMLQRLRAERGAPAPADDPAYAPIYSLADQGKTPREIARELNRQPGEIELILALRTRALAG